MNRRRVVGFALIAAAGIGMVVTGIVLGSPRLGDEAAAVGLLVCVGVFFAGMRLAEVRRSPPGARPARALELDRRAAQRECSETARAWATGS